MEYTYALSININLSNRHKKWQINDDKPQINMKTTEIMALNRVKLRKRVSETDRKMRGEEEEKRMRAHRNSI